MNSLQMLVTYLDLLDVSLIEDGIDGIRALDIKVQILIVATRTLWKLAFCYIVDGQVRF